MSDMFGMFGMFDMFVFFILFIISVQYKMFSTLILCSIIALAFCCISLLYFYYSKLKHIAFLESQLMSLKMMFANYQNSVESKLAIMASGGKILGHPSVVGLLDGDGELNNPEQHTSTTDEDNNSNPEVLSSSKIELTQNLATKNTNDVAQFKKEELDTNSLLGDLLSKDEIIGNGNIPFFKIVTMSSNPIFERTAPSENTGDFNGITEINDNDENIDCIDVEEVRDDDNKNVNTQENELEMDLELEEVASGEVASGEPNATRLSPTAADEIKTVNLQPDVDFKLSGNLENTLEGIMDELEELSEIASVCDDVRTINIQTMTSADLSNLSVKELKELCIKYNIKNKKGSKTELIERLSQIRRN